MSVLLLTIRKWAPESDLLKLTPTFVDHLFVSWAWHSHNRIEASIVKRLFGILFKSSMSTTDLADDIAREHFTNASDSEPSSVTEENQRTSVQEATSTTLSEPVASIDIDDHLSTTPAAENVSSTGSIPTSSGAPASSYTPHGAHEFCHMGGECHVQNQVSGDGPHALTTQNLEANLSNDTSVEHCEPLEEGKKPARDLKIYTHCTLVLSVTSETSHANIHSTGETQSQDRPKRTLTTSMGLICLISCLIVTSALVVVTHSKIYDDPRRTRSLIFIVGTMVLVCTVVMLLMYLRRSLLDCVTVAIFVVIVAFLLDKDSG